MANIEKGKNYLKNNKFKIVKYNGVKFYQLDSSSTKQFFDVCGVSYKNSVLHSKEKQKLRNLERYKVFDMSSRLNELLNKFKGMKFKFSGVMSGSIIDGIKRLMDGKMYLQRCNEVYYNALNMVKNGAECSEIKKYIVSKGCGNSSRIACTVHYAGRAFDWMDVYSISSAKYIIPLPPEEQDIKKDVISAWWEMIKICNDYGFGPITNEWWHFEYIEPLDKDIPTKEESGKKIRKRKDNIEKKESDKMKEQNEELKDKEVEFIFNEEYLSSDKDRNVESKKGKYNEPIDIKQYTEPSIKLDELGAKK